MSVDLTGVDVEQLIGGAGLDDGAPFVLLPVRIETRFVQVEEPVAAPPAGLRDLADRLAAALAELKRVDVAELGPVPPHRNRSEKRVEEHRRWDDTARRIGAARAALDQAQSLLRDPLDGDAAEMDDVAAMTAALQRGLDEAAESVGSVGSDWQRERLLGELDGVRQRADAAAEAIETRALPAARMRAVLAERGGRSRGEPVRGERAAGVSHAALAHAARTYEALLEGVRLLGDDAGTASALADAATTIPLLPTDWKDELMRAVEEARNRATSTNLDALAEAVAGIRAGDREIAVPGPAKLVDKLLVRIYPDDIEVDTHEEELTAAERDAGVTFWQATAAAGSAEPARRAAWRALHLGRGSRRAAWVARMTKPKAFKPTPGAAAAERILAALTTFERRLDEVAAAAAGERIDAVVRAAQGLVKPVETKRPLPQWAIDRVGERYAAVRAACERLDAEARRAKGERDRDTRSALTRLRRTLRMIDLRIGRLRVERPPRLRPPRIGALKKGAWTRAAGSGVLPERFLVVAVSGGQVRHAVAGAPVRKDLKLSIDPSVADDGFALDANGDLVVGESIRWMVDYDEARAKGMAVTLDIAADEAKQGFDRVYVLGVRTGGTADGAARLEGLLDNHHYGQSGLALVPVGTLTNNTEGGAAGFNSEDDPDLSFEVELGPGRFDPAQRLDAAASDGLRLARALGVEPQTLTHVAGADGRDAAEALAVNAALYPATVGSWLEEHAGPLVSLDARDRVRAFALRNVASRGLVPAFRVGPQPYGVLPATAYSGFAPDAGETVPPRAPRGERAAQQRFDDLFTRVLRELAKDWAKVREEHVPYATDPDVGDPRAHFLKVLGLEAVSAAASYRFGVNVAGRHGPAGRDPELEFGLPPKRRDEVQTGAQFGPFALLERFEPILRDAFGVAEGAKLMDGGQVSDAFAATYARIQESRAYELRLLKHAHRLRGPVVGASPQTYLAPLATRRLADLAADTAEDESGRPLLALLARHSVLYEWLDAALRMLGDAGLLSEEDRIAAGSAAQFVISSLLTPRSITRWSYLLGQRADLGGLPGIPFPAGVETMADFFMRPEAGGFRRHQRAAGHASAVAALGAIPPERLEPLVREHLDIASHRLDAWVTGLAQRRLAAMRADTPRGSHVGAYGWVDDLRPDVGHPLAPNVPAALDGGPSKPVHRDPESQGFIHAPSINHAVSAAILRSGYLSQRGEQDVENRMAVNLSSRRTRLAIGLIDGVRAGNRLGALLGYRLERFLHEYHSIAGITLDAGIGPLRQAYPSVAGVEAGLNADAKARQVCDGLAIVGTVNRWIAANTGAEAAGQTVYEVLQANPKGYPWDLDPQSIPPEGDARLDGVLRAIDHVADALDAVADLVVAEAVHQIAMGNHARAAAVLSALGEGKAPPRPEVVETVRTGTPITHRVLLQLPAAPAGTPPGWGDVPLTPRARAEPVLNAWAAALLGPPGDIRLRLVEAASGAGADEVSMAELGLHAIDLVAIVGPGLESGLGEIAARALDARRPAYLDDAVPPVALQADLGRAPGWDDGVRSLAEAAPLIEAIGALVGRARAASAQDYVLAERPPAGAGDGVDVAELAGRVSAARDDLEQAALSLARLLAGDPSVAAADIAVAPRAFLDARAGAGDPLWSARDEWRVALLGAAAFGVPAALPPAFYQSQEQVLRALRESAETAFVELAERLGRADAKLAGQPAAPDLAAAAAELFGEGFTVVPKATLRNADEIATALAEDVASAADLDGWLQGAGAVREASRGLADLLALADANDAQPPSAAAAQLPHVAAEPWLGGTLPSDGDRAGRLSLAIFGPDALPAAGAAGAALLVDQWTEIVPAATETTGVAVHYDQPDATPPQCVLVAVPPQRRGTWQLGELLQVLHDTFELARSRTVELEHLQTTMYGQLLPAISGELVPDAAAGQPVPGNRVILEFGANN